MSRQSFGFTANRLSAGEQVHWETLGVCRDDPELHFPIGTSGPALLQIEQAKRNCRRCPVTNQCLQWALDNGIDDGVFGGMTPEERRAYKTRGGQGLAA